MLRTEMTLQDEIAQASGLGQWRRLAVDASWRLHDLCKHGYGPGTRGHTISEPLALLAMDQYLAGQTHSTSTPSRTTSWPRRAPPLIGRCAEFEAWVRRLLAANADPTIEDRSPFAAM